jgi:2-polyprenyl-3-methyl-5-hydroxy-6-metoxy-1,4-benzoquinol methylase
MNNYPGMTLDRFNHEYEGQPVWNVGKAQQPFVDEFSQMPPASPVLDIGCGTGDLSSHVARLGCDVVGIDFCPKAIELACQQMGEYSSLTFKVCDAFNLKALRQTFRTVLDCCFFHMLDNNARKQYAANVWDVLDFGGELFMLNISVDLPSSDPPRKITPQDIRETFAQGWSVQEIKQAPVDITCMSMSLPGTFARIKKITG